MITIISYLLVSITVWDFWWISHMADLPAAARALIGVLTLVFIFIDFTIITESAS